MARALNSTGCLSHSRAHRVVKAEILAGRLPEASQCEACGRAVNVIWHHPDYARPRFVVALDRKCHAMVHGGTLLEPRTGRLYGYGSFEPGEIQSRVKRFLRLLDGTPGSWADRVAAFRAGGGRRIPLAEAIRMHMRRARLIENDGTPRKPAWRWTGADPSWLLLRPTPRLVAEEAA